MRRFISFGLTFLGLSVALGATPRFLIQDNKLVLTPFVQPAQTTAPTTMSLADYLNAIHAYNLNQVSFSKSSIVSADPTCGSSYYVDVKVRGFWNNIQAQMDFYVQTLTPQSQTRLFNALQTNYAKRGLPACLSQDQFVTQSDPSSIIIYSYHYDPDFTTVNIPADWKPVPAKFNCGNVERPITNCWNLSNPYGSN